jgi:hypothetical protein
VSFCSVKTLLVLVLQGRRPLTPTLEALELVVRQQHGDEPPRVLVATGGARTAARSADDGALVREGAILLSGTHELTKLGLGDHRGVAPTPLRTTTPSSEALRLKWLLRLLRLLRLVDGRAWRSAPRQG